MSKHIEKCIITPYYTNKTWLLTSILPIGSRDIESEARKLGIDVLDAVPWGTHICQFYDTKQDLIDILVPYFKAGLENNEFCIWITSDSLNEKEAEEAIRKAIPNFPQYLASQQIEIIPHTDWYLKCGTFQRKRVLHAWIDKLQQALASGYDGMRVTGDTTWLERRDWSKFINYEKEINNTIGNYHMLAICTYPLHKYRASEIIEVERNCQLSLSKHKGELVLIGSPEGEKSKGVNKLPDTIETNEEAICIISPELIIEYTNQTMDKLFGYEKGELLGRHITIFEPGGRMTGENLKHKGASLGEKGYWEGEVSNIRKDGTEFLSYLTIRVQKDQDGKTIGYLNTQRKIAEHERMENTLKTIVKTALDGFWIVNLEGRFLEVNDSYCQMTGYTREELLKMSIPDIESAEKPEDTALHIQKIKKQGSDHFETRHKHKDGKMIDAEINVNYLGIEGGQLFVFIRDISKYKQAEAELKKFFRAKSGRRLTQLQERFVREGFRELSESAGIRLIFNLCRYRPECGKKIEKCIKNFKNAGVLLSASDQELRRIGVCPRGIFTIKLFRELPAEVLKQNIIERSIYKSSREIFDYLYYSMRDLKIEVFKVIYLNNRSQIIDTADLFEGSRDVIPIRPREIVENAINLGATGLIFVHNHPTGDPAPSRSDKQLTRDLAFVGLILQIKVLDHIIIGADSYFSFADDGLIQKYQDSFLNLKIREVLASRVLYQDYKHLPKGLHRQHQVNFSPNAK